VKLQATQTLLSKANVELNDIKTQNKTLRAEIERLKKEVPPKRQNAVTAKITSDFGVQVDTILALPEVSDSQDSFRKDPKYQGDKQKTPTLSVASITVSRKMSRQLPETIEVMDSQESQQAEKFFKNQSPPKQKVFVPIRK